MSGDTIAFLDPHETHFGKAETGQQFSLEDQLLQDYRDQFKPYEDVLDCRISNRYYSGTLFRFPLRNEPSDLSTKNYTAEKVRQLFHALEKEASVILLFLKNIEEIALFETDQSNTTKQVFIVKLSDRCRQEIGQKKKSLLKQIKLLSERSVSNTNISLTLEIEECSAKGVVLTHKWLVYHQIDARDSNLQRLSSELGLLPWVGFATPLVASQRQALSSNGGRLFCFLPLPPDADSKTGFPVHVHGYFGLTDNRRGLKWPGLDCQNDPTAEWNVRLLEQVGSQAYAFMLVDLVDKQMNEPGEMSIKADLFYQSWPNLLSVENHWKRMLKPMFSILKEKTVLWSLSGKWVRPQDAYLDRINSSREIKQVVLETFTQANESVVTVPHHVLEVIDNMKWTTLTITPSFMRSLLKKKQKGSWNIMSVPKTKKLKLLEYVLQDDNLMDMQGIPLLPLANGSFGEFRSLQYNRDSRAAVYVSTTRHPRSLFYTMDSKFLDDTVQCPALDKLSRAAFDVRNTQKTLPLQLVRMNQTIAINLLRQVLPREWFQAEHLACWYPGQNGHPPESWLPSVWTWIQSDFPNDLSPLEGFPLIPQTNSGCRTIVKLKSWSLAIKKSDQNLHLPQQIVSLLKKIGCVVIENLPPFVNHVSMHKYIASAVPTGVLNVLHALGQQTCVMRISASCSAEEKRALREYLSSTFLSSDQKNLLQHLPIFDAADRRSFLATREGFQVRTVAPFNFELPHSLPLPNASNIIIPRDYQSHSLLQNLGIQGMTPTAFLSSVVFSGMKNGFYSHQQISTLMSWVLRQYNFMQDLSFRASLQQLPFVLNQRKRLVTPCEVLDPRQPVLRQLFEGESDRFPHEDFVKDDILQILQQLGMRSLPNATDILHVAKTVQNFPDDVASRKALALLDFLDQNSSMLKSDWVVQGLKNERWIQQKKDPPPSYPRSMPWFVGKARFYKPSEVRSQSMAYLFGVSFPLATKLCSSVLEVAFDWRQLPTIQQLLKQLRSACSGPIKSMNGSERYHFQAMLKEIYQEASKNVDLVISMIKNDPTFPAWIWHGDGFALPSAVAFVRSCNIDFKPYLFEIPQDFHTFRPFLQRCGVHEKFAISDLLRVLAVIKEKHDRSNLSVNDVADDQKLSCDILQWIVRDGKPLDSELRKNLLVPIMTWDNTLKLLPCRDCTFCDATWLKKGGSEIPIIRQFPMIHDTISTRVAQLLGVPPISTRVTCAEALGIEQTGPHEPVTTRLHNILEEYKEGVGVFRELVQNADDAGASEVQFVLDWRNHPTERLLAAGMADCQGPALLVYNDAVFTDDDLKNISKLAGATKKEDLEKIGRFGLGFSSVYHFTDVPSFVTRNYAVFFDPHTSHLQRHIENPSKPGIKLDLEVNPANLMYFPDQFAPFDGLFGCETNLSSVHSKFYFEGTLFRFAFRTKKGEISDKIYSKEEIQRLVRSFEESSSSLLLFAQNVKKVTFLEIKKNSTSPTSQQVLYEICKETVNLHQGEKTCRNVPTFLQSCATWTRQTTGQNSSLIKTPTSPKQSELVTIFSKATSDKGTESEETCTWLVTSCLGTGHSFQLATSEEGRKQGLLSASGIAGRISIKSDKLEPVCGEVFCFLPLSIPSGLPVHVNGYFAVTSNRRGIWESTTAEAESSQPLEVRWNRRLMEDAVSEAYINFLEDIILMQRKGTIASCESFALWPNPEALQSSVWTTLVKSVYQRISSSGLPLVHLEGKWLPVKQCIYQDAKLQKLRNSETILAMFGYKVVQLPYFAKKGFKLAGCEQIIEERTMSQEKFLREVFFPNISRIPVNLRNPIVCHMIDQCLLGHSRIQSDPLRSLYNSLLSNNRCIPCGPCAEDLAFPKELVNPSGAAAILFTSDDKRFPVGTCYRSKERLLMLQNLGMVVDVLDWSTLLERAKTVPLLWKGKTEQDARTRISCLVNYINVNFTKLELPSKPVETELRRIRMFPVLKKPANYPMQWKGSNDGNVLLPADDMYGEEFKFVVGSLRAILDESESHGCGQLSNEARDLFGFSCREPTVQEALAQLNRAIEVSTEGSTAAHCLEEVSHSIYGYLQELLSKPQGEIIVQELGNKPWILIQGKFLSPSQLAFTWRGNGEPYLFEVSQSLVENYGRLLRETGVRDCFVTSDIVSTLYTLSEDKHGTPMSPAEFRVTRSLIEELLEAPDNLLKVENGNIPLPDHNLVLHPAKELAINDAPWVTSMGNTAYVHEYVPIEFAYKLGAIDIRSKKLAKISRPIGKPFGQREELTDRLKGILKSYPCDVGILKELVQNADDAGATEIHFIYDPRNHPTDQLLSDNWKELQGPALCVYNNRPFSEKDLDGIQRLGIGSKSEDPTKTGQYGIGFNAVYHLTDCPSFISNGDILCILDPHCRYAPGATKENPGLLIGPIQQEERSDYRDVFPCYLEDHFDLTSATMFRFPLRNAEMSVNSSISNKRVSHDNMATFINLFTCEAKEILLFLNHLQKITLSKIEGGQLRTIYSVSVQLTDEDTSKRTMLAEHIKNSKSSETKNIEWLGITYSLKIEDTIREEKWIIHQSVGLKTNDLDKTIPDGRQYGLLPRGGIAAKVSEKSKVPSSSPFTRRLETKYKAFCFLPLPLNTGLPVHVNGHFYLDSARRNLWRDENEEGFASQWNRFLMTKVLSQVYVSLMLVARDFLPRMKIEGVAYFSTEFDVHEAMRWYHQLLPRLDSVSSQWVVLAEDVYRRICRQDERLLPMVKKIPCKTMLDCEAASQLSSNKSCLEVKRTVSDCQAAGQLSSTKCSKEVTQTVSDYQAVSQLSNEKCGKEVARPVSDCQAVSQLSGEKCGKEEARSLSDCEAASHLSRGKCGKEVARSESDCQAASRLSNEKCGKEVAPSVLDCQAASQSSSEKCGKEVARSVSDCEAGSQLSGENCGKEVTQCFWLTPSEGFFNTMMVSTDTDVKLCKILVRIGFKLLYSSHSVFRDFRRVDERVKQITPESVLQFLKENPASFGKLPCPVSKTRLESVFGVLCLLSYCMKAPKFATEMFRLPLLLTEDNVLRCFEKDRAVFLSRFADLVPNEKSRFIHHTLTRSLLDIEKEIFSADQLVLREFDLSALASLLPSIESASWCETNNIIPWDASSGPSEKWLQRVWEFIIKVHRKSPTTFSLDPLSEWPVIPTKSRKLAPLSKGKVILDLTTPESWSPGQKHVMELLCTLKCHEVDAKLISSDGRWDIPPAVKQYLSQPNSTEDILRVLDHLMKETNISGRLTENDMISILQFLQEDVTSLKRSRHLSTVKRLPFFKTFHGIFVTLENVSSIYVIPTGLPKKESDVWMTGNNCLFLAPEPRLNLLYQELLGAGEKTHTDCYINFIFPKFPELEQETRMLHLNYVRRYLLQSFPNESQRPRIIHSLQSLAFIPDTSGKPRTASHFYDPGVKVFAVMLGPESKPPEPFDERSGWLELLREIGLKQEVSKDLFLTFANEVATQALQTNKSKRPELEKKSQALVKHLLKEKTLHDERFLFNISTVKFVASQKTTDELLFLHKQHLVESGNKEQLPPFSCFKNSIPHTFERLVWTSACLLPSWAVPDNKSSKLAKLQVCQKPTLDQIVDNVVNLSRSLSKREDREQPEPRRRLLSQVMIEVYMFLTELSNCGTSDSSESHTPACDTIGERLSCSPCILVESGRVFVRCDQLAYDLDQELPPYLYRVPREYGAFEHLFKRLGAMEKATPVQFAKLLSRLKESCGEENMLVNETNAAKHAVFGLFTTLFASQKQHGSDERCPDNPLAAIKTLYLPSRQQKLHKSVDLVLFDCTRYIGRVPDSKYEFLDRLWKYDLKCATPEQLVDLLPKHLQTTSLTSLVKENLHPDCKDKKCRADVERKCRATDLLRQVVFSPQLVDGFLRILKYQFQKAKLDEKVRNKVRSFQKELGMSCMEVLSTELREMESNTPIPGSQSKHIDCFVGEENGKKHIFIKHGADTSNVRRVLCKEINQLTGCYINEESWLHLAAILDCKAPEDIPSTLDNAGVAEDLEGDTVPQLEPDLGSEVPEELHYLLVQFDDFYFRTGEFVAFEREDSTDEEPKYIYARIIRPLKPSHPVKHKKDRTKRKQKGESNLLSRYLIDIGQERKEVDVLDLYKIKRPSKQNLEEENEMQNEPVSESMELVLYSGDGEQSKQSKAQPSASSHGAAESPKPKTLEDALKEVRKALKEIWKLPEDKRKKALKRLYFRWHPDKNMDMQYIANEVMKFIQNEVDRLTKGGPGSHEDDFASAHADFSDFFRSWHQRARRQRSSYENFRRHNPGFSGFASSSRRRYTGPDPTLSRIWMSQSREDLRSVKHLLTARDPLYYLVCFQCHQVAEKALKAALYALSGVAESQLNSHDLVKLAHDLSLLPGAPDVTPQVAKVSSYYDITRYPNKHRPARAPAEVFTDSQQAQEAFRVATDVLDTFARCLGL